MQLYFWVQINSDKFTNWHMLDYMFHFLAENLMARNLSSWMLIYECSWNDAEVGQVCYEPY